MEELRTSSVHRNLDTKLKIVGLEAHDLIFVMLFAAIMNLFFGQTEFGVWFVFVIPSIMAGVLYVGKRGKPENYLVHLVRFYLSPGFFAAGAESRNETELKKRIYERRI